MNLIDIRLEQQKQYGRAMQSYVLMLYEFILERRPKKMIEVGVCTGQSTKTILMAMGINKFGKLISVDIKNRSDILDADYSDLKEYWHLIKGNSTTPETIQAVKDCFDDGELADMLFIDGNHKMPFVWEDFENYEKLVSPGGIIMMHDVTNANEQVNQAFEKITYPKFCINWGRARNHVIPGFGIIQKPL